MRKTLLLVVMAVVYLSILANGQALASTTIYKVPIITDFSGPLARVSKMMLPAQQAVTTWWNDNKGKKLGVELALKPYDCRYDSAIVAGTWPRVLAECKPIIGFGLGSTDVAALQGRLPEDKVPLIYPTPAYGFEWLPNQWCFHVRPTYLHEFMAAMMWYIKQHPEKRPVKLGLFEPNVPSCIDLSKGTQKYVQEVLEPQGLVKIVALEFCDYQPVDLSSQVKKMVDAQADVAMNMGSLSVTSAFLRACQTYGVNIPTIAPPFSSIWPYAMAMKTYKPFEGHMVTACRISSLAKNSPAYQWFSGLKEKYELKEALWNPVTLLGFSQAILLVRAVEHAAEKVGSDKLTGQAVYETIFDRPFTYEELMGVLPTLKFTKEAPFSLKDPEAMIETVKQGKHVLVDPNWLPVPDDIKKW